MVQGFGFGVWGFSQWYLCDDVLSYGLCLPLLPSHFPPLRRFSNHVEALKQQIEREPYAFPTLKINPDVRDIDAFKFSDFTIEGYKSHAKIAMDMAV